MVKPVILPSRTFSTQTQALEYFKSILYRHEIGETVSSPAEHRLLLELNERHPDSVEKTGPGIAAFYVDKTDAGDLYPVSKNARGIWIRRVDGTTTDWSYQTAIKRPGPRVNIKDALRLAVNTRRLELRARAFAIGPVTCALTGTPIASKDEADVIYRDPTWDDLVEGFIGTQGGWAAVETNSGFGGIAVGGRLTDAAIAQAWLDYWDTHANLLIVAADVGGRGPRS